jgi:glyoxylase-like metal-dependent hydrolase (beta-lactamase superfamily II)
MTAAGTWSGGVVTPRSRCVLAPNPGPMTLDGTNTWVLREPGGARAIVVDPGPADRGHLERVLAEVGTLGATVALTVLTHRHLDHTEGAAAFAEMSGAPVRALDAALCIDAEPLRDGDRLAAGSDDVGLPDVRVVATPGHTSDSICLLLAADMALLTGDTVLGRGTSVVAHPDGALGPYLMSLQRLSGLAQRGAISTLLPGHGPPLPDAAATLADYIQHRAQRLDQVIGALEAGARTPLDVVERVYADVDRSVWPAAEQTVRAQLEYLRDVRGYAIPDQDQPAG